MIVIEGIPGVGKSTLVKKLGGKYSDYMDCCFEEVEGEYLDNFYRDKKIYAFEFQIFCLTTRFKQYEKAREKLSNKGKMTIFDRSLWGDMVFADVLHEDGFMTNSQHKIYKDFWKSVIYEKEHFPDFVFFLKADVDTVMRRIKERSRDCEKIGISREYLERLNQKYDAKVNELACESKTTVKVVEWEDFDDSRICNKIERYYGFGSHNLDGFRSNS